MNIEVTQKTFNLIFDEKNDFIKIEQKELYVKNTFYNKYHAQKGFSMYVHVSHVWQYYLTDINA
tara:strand:+ start:277 stop:468 length:192 start_codon:yes stop_codon:yes gene_type:complete